MKRCCLGRANENATMVVAFTVVVGKSQISELLNRAIISIASRHSITELG
jgi:hypothetical protein